jgi:AcrR family transcriptional regulator
VARKIPPKRARPPRGESAAQVRSAVVDAVAERLTDKINEKSAQAKARPSAKASLQVEALQQVADHMRALDVWTRRGPRTRQPRFAREDIAAAALDIADAEGFDAVSMRRLAAEVGAGTMTLYHYVRTKDELLTLLTDAVMGEVVVPDDQQFPDDWRAAMTLIANRTRASLTRHPWMFDITDDPPIGPNSVRHFDQSLQAVSSLDLPLTERIDIVLMVDEYVFGYCLHERNNQVDADDQSVAYDRDLVAYVSELLKTGEYPQLEALAEEYGLAEAWALIGERIREPGRFERGLTRLLDGIGANFSRRDS